MQRIWAAALVLGIALAAWLWPLGFGLRMPVGGDATRFQIGLMATMQDFWGQGRLPIWVDRWGFGFPGVAESQMGVFYPPHWFLYGLMSPEWAYTASVVFHVMLAGFGGMWAARSFGISAWGSALAGWGFAASGFFLIHLPHQWGYSTGCWMPWAWGLAWRLAKGGGGRRTVAALAAVLAVQMLYGHFQLAFTTQMGVFLIALGTLAVRKPARGAAVAAAWVLGILLATIQLLPTAGLARLASGDRNPDFLTSFASTPLHLVNFVAPDLFHHSPLWRPVAWDPMRTSPEESLAYLGLAPLFLACVGLVRGWRKGPEAKILGLIILVTLAFSLGPFCPGFRWLSQLPGFSFFRAPARWSLATTLALALLAGLGWDALGELAKDGRSLRRFVAIAAVWIGLVLLAFEAAYAAKPGGGWAGALQSALERVPLPGGKQFTGWQIAVSKSQANDFRVEEALARRGTPAQGVADLIWGTKRLDIYADELWRTGLLLVSLGGLSFLAARPKWFRGGLFALALLDLWALGRELQIDHGPIRSLVEQSPVLARLAGDPEGPSRVVAPGTGNLLMIAGMAAIPDYRTLDLPAAEALDHLAGESPDARHPLSKLDAAQRAVGARYRLIGLLERANWEAARGVSEMTPPESIPDLALAGWLYGTAWAQSRHPEDLVFLLRRVPGGRETVAWTIPIGPGRDMAALEALKNKMWLYDHEEQATKALEVMKEAAPLPVEPSPDPEEFSLEVRADRPSILILSRTFTPRWKGWWEGPDGKRPAEIRDVLGGWQGLEVPGTGTWRLTLRYDHSDLAIGAGVTAAAGLAWLALISWGWRKRRER